MVGQISVPFFTPIESPQNPFLKLADHYIWFGGDVAIQNEEGNPDCLREFRETSMLSTLLKITTMIATCGLSLLAAIAIIYYLRSDSEFKWEVEVGMPMNDLPVEAAVPMNELPVADPTFRPENQNKTKGKRTLEDGSIYEGDWVDGKRTGRGELITACGRKYIRGFLDGKGTLTELNGTVYEGSFEYDKKVGQGSINHLNLFSYKGE